MGSCLFLTLNYQTSLILIIIFRAFTAHLRNNESEPTFSDNTVTRMRRVWDDIKYCADRRYYQIGIADSPFPMLRGQD